MFLVRWTRAIVALVMLLAMPAVDVLAQATVRRPTTIEALRRFPGYYHMQSVLLRGEIAASTVAGEVALRSGESQLALVMNEVSAQTGSADVRGTFIDVGRLTPTDPRLASYDRRPDPEHWPMPGELLIVSVTAAEPTAAEPSTTPSLRTLAIEPWRFDGQPLTLVGQFGGRNLFGDLPAAPAKDRYDFVLRNAEGAVWVTGVRPKGKGFDLNVDARVDTSYWLKVTGILKRERGLVVLEGSSIATTPPPARPAVAEQAPKPAAGPPGEVVFSSPTEGETGVGRGSPLRVQFSRGVDPASLDARVVLGYLGDPSTETMPLASRVSYDVGNHAIEIRPVAPLDPFKTVRLRILEGVKMFDGAPLAPWTVTFSVGDR